MTPSRTWLSRMNRATAPGGVMWIGFYVGAERRHFTRRVGAGVSYPHFLR